MQRPGVASSPAPKPNLCGRCLTPADSVQCQSLARFLKELGASNQVDKQLIALFASSGTNSSLTSRKLFLPALRIIARRGAWRPSLRYTHMPEGMAELERAAALNASLFRDGMLATAAKLPEVHAGLADCSTQVADAARFFEQHARSTGRHSKPRAGTASARWTDALLLLEHTRKVLAAVVSLEAPARGTAWALDCSAPLILMAQRRLICRPLCLPRSRNSCSVWMEASRSGFRPGARWPNMTLATAGRAAHRIPLTLLSLTQTRLSGRSRSRSGCSSEPTKAIVAAHD